jgi:hypothetical protein
MFDSYEIEKYKAFQRQEDLRRAERNRLLLESSPHRSGSLSGSAYPKFQGRGSWITRNALTGLLILASLAAVTFVR